MYMYTAVQSPSLSLQPGGSEEVCTARDAIAQTRAADAYGVYRLFLTRERMRRKKKKKTDDDMRKTVDAMA